MASNPKACRLYLIFLHLYPATHRAKFGSEMVEVFASAAPEHRKAGKLAYFWFVLRELGSLLYGALPEWFVYQSQSPVKTAEEPGHWLDLVQDRPAVELAAAQKRVQENISLMVEAIATHRFEKARYYARAEELEQAYIHKLQNEGSGELT